MLATWPFQGRSLGNRLSGAGSDDFVAEVSLGGSVMVPLPPEILAEAGLAVDTAVVIRSRRGHVEIEAETGPDGDAMEFMDSFLAEYGEAMAKLADR